VSSDEESEEERPVANKEIINIVISISTRPHGAYLWGYADV